MSKITVKKLISAVLSVVMVAAVFAGCAKTEEEETTNDNSVQQMTEEQTTEKQTTTEPVTAAPTTQAETTTAKPKDGESIQNIINTLESKHFYMSGAVNLAGGQKMDAKMTCDGDNYRMEIVSNQMKMSMIYLDSVPYIVNNATNSYAVVDENAINSLDQVMASLSGLGVTMNSKDIADMKNMMSNFDANMDYSKYIEGGEYSEYNSKVDGQDYLCSSYKTEYGSVKIYTQNGEMKIIEVYDETGLRQMSFVVSAFIPEVLSPITLNGLTKTASILNLFTSTGR